MAAAGLTARNLTVTFSGIDVVSGVDIDLHPGEVHAITGENGAGKSSLGKAIAGVYRSRLGELRVGDKLVDFQNPREALAEGIALIHQEPVTFPDLNIAENVFAGNFPRRGPFVDWASCLEKTAEILRVLGLDLDPAARVDTLSVAQRQLVELASGLAHHARIWIFDETTAPLTPNEVDRLFEIIKTLRSDGCCIAIISHHMHEVFEISDRITVLRDGKKIAERITSDSNPREIVHLMVGRELEEERFPSGAIGVTALQTDKLSGPGFSEIDLEVRSGEVLGIGGLVGAGRTELARALFGVNPATSGSINLFGRQVAISHPKVAIEHGIAMVSEDRIHEGLHLIHSIAFNSSLAALSSLSNRGWTSNRSIAASSQEYARRFGLVHRSLDQPVSELSGGNQQKVVLAKWLATHPRILILDEPTRGVDVGAKHEVHRIVRELANGGLAVLLISSDLKELLTLSDSVGVMRLGKLVAQLPVADATERSVMEFATGQVSV
jgi:rhamnose transport system ATP-binding protein